ncbi:MAG: Bax inhibitor-1 family protein [Acidobacteriota bacterium]|nr:Bax inhibitor-1 family protein [Acidobacteriota bacterium]
MANVTTLNGVRVIEANTASLLGKVLWITTAGFLFTALGAYLAPPTLGISYMLVILLNFGLIFAISAAARRSSALGLVLFYVFTTLMGVQISPILNQYTHSAAGQAIVFQAAMTTALGMALMAIVAQFANFNYMKVGRIAFFALIGLIVIGFLGMFVHFVSPSIYAWLTLAIFSVLLLVDFMRLKDRGQQYGPVQMALSIYLDALNIFLALLQIFGGGSRSRR